MLGMCIFFNIILSFRPGMYGWHDHACLQLVLQCLNKYIVLQVQRLLLSCLSVMYVAYLSIMT